MNGLFDLTGRAALVSGGTRGIGFAMAEALADAGARVAVAGRDAAAAAEAAARIGRGAIGLRADVARSQDCDAAVAATVAAFGRLDVLHAVAGVNRRRRPEAVTDAEWDEILDVNLKGTFALARAAHPHLRDGGMGRIVTVGSILSVMANEVTAAYAASKGGVVQLTRSLAAAWARDGITANCILPGWIDTDLTVQARADMPTLDESVRARTPMGRWGAPADLRAAALFLSAPGAGFVTGVALPVDGGFTIRA